ncbi:glucuronate isomerase [Leifsonia sp. 21MFCrub1.1]|uniref:glucuronate isomerase n=1 Tax=Leifsonia sp. 21MFCrub1.1 TaxID=1798223 RepID=UPI0008928256|nr:glucuronate isomerase [Leifsonia sp. 21MFCrub1.1]SEB08631.1 glucuronate isomerase [Leifsonia sp. 21MFCrub1.1]
MHQPRRRDPDRLLPAEPRTRGIARDLYRRVADAPIVSPHGHVPVEWLAEDQRFREPADLLITHDHYVTRLLHAGGIDLGRLGVGQAADPRSVWRLLAENWHLFAGTASGYWLEEALASVLEIEEELSPATADPIYDRIAARIAEPDFTPRALFERFGIEVLATTDDPLDDLDHHDALRESGFRVVPTFRPDRYLDPDARGFRDNVDRLLAVTGQPATFAGYLAALEERRRHFVDHGAVSADHGVEEPVTLDLPHDDAQQLFAAVTAGTADDPGKRAFRAHMLFQMARMSVDDGLVMTVHAGVLRNHHTATFDAYGPDTGHDIPVRTDFVRGLRPLLERFGNADGFHLVLFAVDETVYSRELAPLAGFYRSVYIGAPWWFLDAPEAIGRFRSAVTETTGFFRGSGFIDDTRAFLSIPTRHDTARRADAAFLARWVAEGRLALGTAERIADELVGPLPRRVFKL